MHGSQKNAAHRADTLFENNQVDVCCSNESVILTGMVGSIDNVVFLLDFLGPFDRPKGDKIVAKLWEML
jgi:hypothetical protein